MGIIGRRIGSKAAGWPMFEALIDRQDDHLASTTQTAMHQHARKLALHTGIIALILIENGFDGWRHGHAFPSCTKGLTGRAGGLKSIVLAIPDRFPAKVDLSVPVGCLPDPARKRMAPLHPLRSGWPTPHLCHVRCGEIGSSSGRERVCQYC